MAHPRSLIAFSLLWGCEPSAVVGYGEFDPDAPAPLVYEVKEWRFESAAPSDNPFLHYVDVEVWRGDKRYKIDGFYDGIDGDGDRVWRARFMPTEAGAWNYTWSVGGRSGRGVLDVQQQRGANPGHVHLDQTIPSTPVLRHDDGTVHYWFGGKAFTARNYGLRDKDGQENRNPPDQPGYDAHYTDEELKTYLDLMQDTGHNGTRLKIALYPLADDGLTWDLSWIRRAEQWIRWMQERKIYCQVTFFDSKSRKKNSWFESSDVPNQHPLNAWESNDDEPAKKQNYIRYIVARFAAYSNVYWELVDQVDAFGPEAGATFVALPSEHLESLRKHDPYDLAIGADAKTASLMSSLDIEFSREDKPLTVDSPRVTVFNEVRDNCPGRTVEPQPAQNDATIRDEVNRPCYRNALWRRFVSGGFGANEASWLDLSQPFLDSPVEAVMRDHGLLRSTVTSLGVGLDELVPDPAFLESPTQPSGTRAKSGQLYVAYFLLSANTGAIQVRLPAGEYTYCWSDPEAPDPGASSTGASSTGASSTGTSSTGTSSTGTSSTGASSTGASSTGTSSTGTSNPFDGSSGEQPHRVTVTTDLVPLRRPSGVGDRVLLIERYVDGEPDNARRCLLTEGTGTVQ